MCFNIIGHPDNLEVLIRPKALCDDCASYELGTKRTARVTGWLHLFERVASSFSDFLGARFKTEPPRGSSITASCLFVSTGCASFVRAATARGFQMTLGCPSPADGTLAEVAVLLPRVTVSVILLVGNIGAEILLMTREDLISDP